jgi:tRNA(Met) C34 N-acetyltransferase TmcA
VVEVIIISIKTNKINYLFLSILIFVTSPGKTNADSLGNIANTLAEEVLVKTSVDTDIPG